MCLGSLSSCITQVFLSLRSANWWLDILLQNVLIEGRIYDSFDVWQVVQLLKIQSTPDHHHHVWLLVWCSFDEMLCWFFIRCNGTRTFKKVKLLVHQFTEYLSKILGIIKIFLAKCETSLCVLLSQQWLLPWNSPMDAQSLSDCWIMNTHLNWGMWGLQFFRCCSGLFYDLLDESSFHSWSNFGRSALLGRFITIPSFLHLWIMALTVVRWSPNALEMALQPISRLINLNYFVSHLFFNFFRSWHDELHFKHALLCQAGSI